MAITKCVERYEGRKSEKTRTGRTYTRVFYVSCSATTDYPDTVYSAVDPTTSTTMPTFGDTYPSDSWATVTNISAIDIKGDGKEYFVTVDYDTHIYKSSLFVENPLLRTPVIQWTFERTPEVMTWAYGSTGGYATDDWSSKTWNRPGWAYDAYGNRIFKNVPIVNTAGQEFDPPVMRDTTTIVGVCERNELYWNGTQAINYMDAVNSDEWLGFSPGQARVHNISATYQYESGIWYYSVRYEIHIRNHWLKIVPNTGLAEIKDGKLTVSKDPDNNAMLSPVLLDENGARVVDGGDMYYMAYEIYHYLPFSVLNLE